VGAWLALFATGITFIMTASSVEMVMRSTVSIVFVMQVDELLYGVSVSKRLKEQVERTSFMIFSKVPFTKNQPASEEVIEHFIQYGQLPMLLMLTCAIVYGIRNMETVHAAPNCKHDFWSGVNTAFDQWSTNYIQRPAP